MAWCRSVSGLVVANYLLVYRSSFAESRPSPVMNRLLPQQQPAPPSQITQVNIAGGRSTARHSSRQVRNPIAIAYHWACLLTPLITVPICILQISYDRCSPYWLLHRLLSWLQQCAVWVVLTLHWQLGRGRRLESCGIQRRQRAFCRVIAYLTTALLYFTLFVLWYCCLPWDNAACSVTLQLSIAHATYIHSALSAWTMTMLEDCCDNAHGNAHG